MVRPKSSGPKAAAKTEKTNSSRKGRKLGETSSRRRGLSSAAAAKARKPAAIQTIGENKAKYFEPAAENGKVLRLSKTNGSTVESCASQPPSENGSIRLRHAGSNGSPLWLKIL